MSRGIGPGAPWIGGLGGLGLGRTPRIARGAIRAAMLALLVEGPRNGYQIMQELAQRSGGAWRPSPGSIYPTLAQLEDEELISHESGAGTGRVFKLTDRGRAAARRGRGQRPPWEDAVEDGVAAWAVLGMLRELAPLIGHLAHHGTPEQRAAGKRILNDTRRRLAAVLFGGGDDDDSDDDEEDEA